MTEKFIIGLAGAPFGLKGFVKIRPFSGEIDHLLKLKSVIVNKDGKEQLLEIEESVPSQPGLLMRFAGIDSPEKAKTLTGAHLLVERENAAPLYENEYYIEDLKGQEVCITNNGIEVQTIGVITDIIEGGGGELAEIKLISGELKLVPFRNEFFPEIDPKKGKVFLQNPWILE